MHIRPFRPEDGPAAARPFFLARGWRIVRRQTVVRRGVRLENLVMETERSTV